MVKGEYKIDYVTEEFHLFCAFHQMQNYFRSETELHYKGTAFEMHYINGALNVKAFDNLDYLRPQIIYVPAERNLLAVLKMPRM